jgi:hypothetical protein
MTITYDTLGGSIDIEPTGAVAPADLNTSVAIVGGYDQANADASVTAGESDLVTSRSQAESLYGTNSELATQTALALGNDAGEVYAVPLSETETTESFTASASDTLANTPISDPRVTTSEITITDTTTSTDLTVNVVDETPTQPADSETAEVNVRTGEWAADSSSDYDVTYSYADYASAIDTAVSESVRNVAVCTEADSVVATLESDLDTAAGNFRFSRGVVGADPAIDPTAVGSYTPSSDDWRIVEAAPARGENGDGDAVRTVGAIAGLLASQPVDVTGSITYDMVAGLGALGETYTPQQAANFDRVTALTDEYEVAEGVTTSTEDAFSDIYKAEIIDAVVELLYDRIRSYRGGSNANGARRRFRSRLKRTLSAQSVPDAQPPLLASGDGSRPYSVQVSQGTNDTEADVDIGIDPAPIAKTVNIDVSVGPISFNGVSV